MIRHFRILLVVLFVAVCFIRAAVVRAEESTAILSFDRAVYPAGSCVKVALDAPALVGLKPSAQIAVVHGGVRAGSVAVELIESPAHSRSFAPKSCVQLSTPDKAGTDHALPIAPGDTLAAMAVDENAKPLALALAFVGNAPAFGRFRPAIDATVNGAEGVPSGVGIAVDSRGRKIRYALGHVIMRDEHAHELARFLKRRNGQLLNSRSTGERAHKGGDHVDYHLVEVDTSTVDIDGFAGTVERWTGASGEVRFSSREAMALMALVVEELQIGRYVELDIMLDPLGQPKSNEGAPAGMPIDFFGVGRWFNPLSTSSDRFAHLGEGLALSQIVAKPTLSLPVDVAIIDRGFAGPGDYVPAFNNPDYGVPFGTIRQCEVDDLGFANCAAGVASGASNGMCSGGPCPWHGTGVYSAAAALLDNGFGAAGTGSSIVRPNLFKASGNMFSTASAIAEALKPPSAEIINLSRGKGCAFAGINLCDPLAETILTASGCIVFQIAFPPLALTPCPGIIALVAATEHEADLENATDAAWNKGVITIGAASDNNENVDEEIIVPCIYEHVVCVSSVAPAPPVPPATVPATLISAGLGYGNAVRVWAPGNVVTTPAPPNSLAAPSISFGNSIAAPVVSGALAVALAINPTLGPKALVNLLLSSNCSSTQTMRTDGTACVPSPDPLVDGRGYFDFLELIRQARISAMRPSLTPCTGGWDADEVAGIGDSKAYPVKVKKLEPMVGYTVIHGDKADLSIHALNQPPLPTVDVDWYDVRFAPDPTGLGNVSAFNVKLTLLIPDASLGALTMDVFWRKPSGAGIFPLPLQFIASPLTTTASGDLTTIVKMRSDIDYFVRVSARTAASTNCYAGLAINVLEIISVFPRPDE